MTCTEVWNTIENSKPRDNTTATLAAIVVHINECDWCQDRREAIVLGSPLLHSPDRHKAALDKNIDIIQRIENDREAMEMIEASGIKMEHRAKDTLERCTGAVNLLTHLIDNAEKYKKRSST